MTTAINNNVSMDWDDVLENDGQEFIILPEGDYNFTITNFERGRFPGSAKMQPSNKAMLTLQVTTDKGIAFIHTDLILNRLVEFRVASFFRCIGIKKQGERLNMDWDHIVGKQGRAHFKPRTYTDRDGKERQANAVDRFYDYDEQNFPTDDGWMELVGDNGDIPFN